MSETEIVQRTEVPVTVESMQHDLQALGLRSGMVLLVHASLSALGWVCGGSVAVVEALRTVIGGDGALVMPTHSGHLSDPENWVAPAVPAAWWTTIRASMPAFDPVATPTRGMGAIPEAFRSMTGVRRSNHPHLSFAAWGARAHAVLARHDLTDPLGEGSPLARIHALDGHVLLLGVGHDRNTSLHLAERKAFAGQQDRNRTGAPVLGEQGREWIAYLEPAVDASDFERLGNAYSAASVAARSGKIGLAGAVLMPQRELVDFAMAWLRAHRDPFGRPGGAA